MHQPLHRRHSYQHSSKAGDYDPLGGARTKVKTNKQLQERKVCDIPTSFFFFSEGPGEKGTKRRRREKGLKNKCVCLPPKLLKGEHIHPPAITQTSLMPAFFNGRRLWSLGRSKNQGKTNKQLQERKVCGIPTSFFFFSEGPGEKGTKRRRREKGPKKEEKGERRGRATD